MIYFHLTLFYPLCLGLVFRERNINTKKISKCGEEMLRSTLIYPNLHFTDDQTIKESLLLYDKLYRIVPEEITPKDSDRIKKLKEEVIKDRED